MTLTPAERSRQWREQKYARGECYGASAGGVQGCTNQAHGMLCERCKRYSAQDKAQESLRQRITRKFLHDWWCVWKGLCIECEQPAKLAICKKCQRKRFTYKTSNHVRPLSTACQQSTNAQALGSDSRSA